MMRARRTVGIAVVVLAAGAVFAATALAGGGQTNGTGKSFLGYSVGYNAKSDKTGNFEYHPTINGSTANIHCNDYNRYRETTTGNGQFPKTIFNSTNCFDDAGVQYFVHIEAIDRGEPGTSDAMCIKVAKYPAKSNPNLVTDCGIIQNGNVQIHTENNILTSELVATS
jgi:hypothetical protein